MLRDIFLNFYTIEDKASMLTVSFEALTAILMVQYHLNLNCFTIIIHDYKFTSANRNGPKLCKSLKQKPHIHIGYILLKKTNERKCIL